MSERDYLIAGVVHELAVEVRKAMPKEDNLRTTEATGELRRVSTPELSELVHEVAVEFHKAMKKAEEAKPSAPSW